MSDKTATPFINKNDTLHIPLDSDPKYHHWKGGQSIIATLKEINAPVEAYRNYLLPAAFEQFLVRQKLQGIGYGA